MSLNKYPFIDLNLKAVCLYLAVLPIMCTCLCVPLRAQTLTCPNDVTIEAQPDQCGTTVFFEDYPFSSSVPLIDTIYLPPSGTYLTIGSTQIILGATNVNNVNSTCTFYVTVVEHNSSTVVCKNNVQLDLEGKCERPIKPQEILVDTTVNCMSAYKIFRVAPNGSLQPGIITSDDLGATITVQAKDPLTGKFCTTTVTVTGGVPPSITCPPDITVFCNVPLDTANTGSPLLTGCFQSVSLTWSDDMNIFDCTDLFPFYLQRTFTATDPFGNKYTCKQGITGERINLFQLTFPPNFDGTDMPPLGCSDILTTAQVADPKNTGTPLFMGFPPNTNQGCKVAMSYTDTETKLCGDSYEIIRKWQVVKLCPPTQTITFFQTIQVLDTLGPQFLIPSTIHLSTACPLTFTLPGFDLVAECSPYGIEIITPWDTLNTNGGVTTVQPVLGNHLVYYRLTDACGYVRQKVATLVIANQSIASCPANDTITCDTYADTLAPALQTGNAQVLKTFGYPVFSVNCNFTVTETDSITVDTCGKGTVVRKFQANANGNQVNCTQTINIQHQSDFEVIFPSDTVLCTAPETPPTPQYVNVSCEDMNATTADSIVSSIAGACYTIYRYWTVTNKCIYDGTEDDDDVEVAPGRWKDGGDGVVHFTQVIQVKNTQPSFPNGCSLPDVVLPGGVCEASVTVPTPQISGCGGIPQLSVSGDLGIVLGATEILSPGTYTVNYLLADDCGKTKTCSSTFKVVDTVNPVAICTSMVTVTLPATNPSLTVVNAQSFAAGSTDNCPGFQFSFSENPNYVSQIYDCCQAGTYPLVIWVTDDSGNQDTCHSTLKLQTQPGFVCDCFNELAGTIKTEKGEGIKNVSVKLTPTAGNPATATTNSAGEYSFMDPPPNFTLKPEKNSDTKNGITTFDLVLIRRHILAIEVLDSPYKIIAADANKSNSVTTADLVVLQRLILNIIDTLPNDNTSWRFVDAKYVFPNPGNPFSAPFPESIQVSNLTGDLYGVNFIGLKVGDVNNSANTQLFTKPDEEDK